MADPVSAALAIASTVAGMQQASSARKRQAAQLAQQQQQATLRQSIEERRLERQRRSEKASARARLGAAGVGSSDGSGGAVLRGLDSVFDQELVDSRAMFNASMAGGANLLDEGPGLAGALNLASQVVGLGGQVVGVLDPPSPKKTTPVPKRNKRTRRPTGLYHV